MPYTPDLSGCALDGRYELHAVIGEGAFGRVYRGFDRRLARAVAIKVIKPWWAEDPDWVGSFEREAQLLARVSDPGIVQIFDVGQAPEGLYYVSELVEGESLAGRLESGPLDPWDACAIAEQLCRALARAHAERIIHRDVKPANILISERDQVKVGDFGVARLAEGTSDGAVATVVGTPRYMAPEQGRGLPTTPATDIYSVGIVLYEMIAGQPPFTGASAVELALRHLQDSPPRLPSKTPRALIDVIDRALAKGPEKRFPEGGAMADALADARRSAGSRRGREKVAAVPIPGRRSVAGSGADAVAGNGAQAPAGTEGLTSTRLLEPPKAATDRTRVASKRSPRRNLNPAGRRRSLALLGSVLLLIAGMVVAGILLGGRRRVSVPNLRGLSRTAVAARVKGADLRASFSSRYADSPRDTAIAQAPVAGRRVDGGAGVRVVLSQGPEPVEVPLVVGEDRFAAQSELSTGGLSSIAVAVPAPGQRPGTVTRQTPSGGSVAPPKARVILSVAETPTWRPRTSFAGSTGRQSVAFRILGTQWRIVYTMNYQDSCSFFVFCSGPPRAEVVNPRTGAGLSSFDLNNGSDQTQTVRAGPGLFEIKVSPGSDKAEYSIDVEDYY